MSTIFQINHINFFRWHILDELVERASIDHKKKIKEIIIHQIDKIKEMKD